MKYLYTSDMCSKCIALKERFARENVEYRERDAKRLKDVPDDYDKIDVEAFAVLCEQNMELPVVVEA